MVWKMLWVMYIGKFGVVWQFIKGIKDILFNFCKEDELDFLKIKGVICIMFQRGLDIIKKLKENRN